MEKQEKIQSGLSEAPEDKKEEITFIQVKFGLNFAEDELIALANEPHSKLAVRTKQYIYKCVRHAARQYLDGKNVTEI